MGMTIEEYLKSLKKDKPKSFKRQTEHLLQSACVRWFRAQYPKFLIVAFPNAARRTVRMGAWMKDEGMLPGVADLEIIADGRVMFVEMKTKKGVQQATQKEFQEAVERLGFRYAICRSLPEFVTCVEKWLDVRITKGENG